MVAYGHHLARLGWETKHQSRHTYSFELGILCADDSWKDSVIWNLPPFFKRRTDRLLIGCREESVFVYWPEILWSKPLSRRTGFWLVAEKKVRLSTDQRYSGQSHSHMWALLALLVHARQASGRWSELKGQTRTGFWLALLLSIFPRILGRGSRKKISQIFAKTIEQNEIHRSLKSFFYGPYGCGFCLRY